MPDSLKDLLPDFLPGSYKQNAALTTAGIFVVYNIVALLTCLWVKHTALETKVETPPTQIQVNGPISTANCSVAGIGQANSVSIQCADKAAAQSNEAGEHKKLSQHK
jgi:hypothetical protein